MRITTTEVALEQYLVIYRPVCKIQRSHVIATKILEVMVLVIPNAWNKFGIRPSNLSTVIKKIIY